MGRSAVVGGWRSRIVGHGTEPPERLRPNPRNWRLHPRAQRQALAGVLNEVGWVQDVIVNQRTGHVIDGHARVEIAIERGEQQVPVVYVDLDENEEGVVLAALDPLAGMAMTDSAKLAALLGEISVKDEALRAMLVGPKAGQTEPDAVPPAPEEPMTQPGDLWILGEHRLLCGDSTNPDDVRRLLEAARPALTVTDPPYGVHYDPNWRNEEAAKGTLNYGAWRVGEVENDDRADWAAAWELVPSDVIYCWHAAWYASTVQAGLESAGFQIRCQIVWAKPSFRISRGHYHWRHEPCWYAVRRGASAHWVGDRKQTTVWEINLDPNVEGGHSAQKPVECMERAIRNHDAPEVYDPFVGSGTTLIACERLARRCYAMDINPRYVDVAVRRWEQFTGGKAVRETEGSRRKVKART